MKTIPVPKTVAQLALMICMATAPAIAADGPLDRTQTIALSKGWNSVFLEVEPADGDPAKVFGGKPIDVVAAYFWRSSPAQFVSDPGTNLFRELGWAVWYGAERPDAFLKTLFRISADQAYLIHATEDYSWSITGEAVRASVRWKPDAFNLVGFTLAETGAPTFAQFFSGSKAHRSQRIYRLANDRWRKVTEPEAEAMRPGEAFWIFCEGASAYPGPLGVETVASSGLNLYGGEARIVLRNHVDHPIAPTLKHVVAAGKTSPLAMVIEVVGDRAQPFKSVAVPKPSGSWEQALPPLEAREAIAVPFAPRSERMTEATHRSLLKIETDLGTVHWLPVTSSREDLEP